MKNNKKHSILCKIKWKRKKCIFCGFKNSFPCTWRIIELHLHVNNLYYQNNHSYSQKSHCPVWCLRTKSISAFISIFTTAYVNFSWRLEPLLWKIQESRGYWSAPVLELLRKWRLFGDVGDILAWLPDSSETSSLEELRMSPSICNQTCNFKLWTSGVMTTCSLVFINIPEEPGMQQVPPKYWQQSSNYMMS